MTFIPSEPGVYFGLPMEAYLQIKANGSSSVRDMDVSALDCWAKHYNPTREPIDTAATIQGSAFHAAILEGMDALTARFYPKLNREAFPDVLWSVEELRAKCDELGLKKGGKLSDMAGRLVAEGGVDPQILGPAIEIEYLAENEGKQVIPHDRWDHILQIYDVMEAANIRKAFTGGEPEVTIVWRDPVTGLLCKCRIDYLKPSAAFELKSFSNMHGKNVEKAVADAFIYNRYHLQGVFIERGLEAFPSLMQYQCQPDGECEPYARTPDHSEPPFQLAGTRLYFIFYQSGGVPNVIVREFGAHGAGGVPNEYWQKGERDVSRGLDRINRYLREFGTRPWITEAIIKPWDDTDFPPFALS